MRGRPLIQMICAAKMKGVSVSFAGFKFTPHCFPSFLTLCINKSLVPPKP